MARRQGGADDSRPGARRTRFASRAEIPRRTDPPAARTPERQRLSRFDPRRGGRTAVVRAWLAVARAVRILCVETGSAGAGNRADDRGQPVRSDRAVRRQISAQRQGANCRYGRHVRQRAEYGWRLAAVVGYRLRIHRDGRIDPFVPVCSVGAVQDIDRKADRSFRENGSGGNQGADSCVVDRHARDVALCGPDRGYDADS